MSEDRPIKYLLNRYKSPLPSEKCASYEYHRRLNEKYRQNERIWLAGMLLRECDAPRYVMDDTFYWIKKFKSLKFVNRTWTLEKIISFLILNSFDCIYPDYDVTGNVLWRKYDFKMKEYVNTKKRFYDRIVKEV